MEQYKGKIKDIMLKSQASGLLKWKDSYFIETFLDIPHGLNVKDRVKINLTEK